MVKGFPQTQLDNVQPKEVQEIVSSLRQLHDKGQPKTDQEVEQRIDDYFRFCEQSSIRPGIESLALSLHVSRQTLFRWGNGEDCSKRRSEAIQSAKAFVAAYVEQALLGGKISPPSGIFLAKNWLGYKDAISLEEATPPKDNKKSLQLSDVRKELEKYAIKQKMKQENITDISRGNENEF